MACSEAGPILTDDWKTVVASLYSTINRILAPKVKAIRLKKVTTISENSQSKK